MKFRHKGFPLHFTSFISLSTALQETKRFEAVANLVVEKICYKHAHCQNITRGMLCHTRAVFLDQIQFKQKVNTMAQGYRCLLQISDKEASV